MMAAFIGLNVEREDDFAEDLEDTTEIQLEEAFRLYNNALRLHSQRAFKDAFEAFLELFKSEIFKDPDNYSEFRRDREDEASGNSALQVENAPLPLVLAGGADASANSVPQFLHLSHKARGQFVLDYNQWILENGTLLEGSTWQKHAIQAFRDWGWALEFDDTDLDLWKRAARVAEVLPGRRIPRFCLESVLAGDDDSGEAIDLSGLDEAYAAGELQGLLDRLEDDLSKYVQVGDRPKQPLLKALLKRNDPFPYLPKQASDSRARLHDHTHKLFTPKKYHIHPTGSSWSSVGQSLLQILDSEQQGSLDLGPGTALTIESSTVSDAHDGQPTHHTATQNESRGITQNYSSGPESLSRGLSGTPLVQSPKIETIGAAQPKHTNDHVDQGLRGSPEEDQQIFQEDVDMTGQCKKDEHMTGQPEPTITDSVQLPTRKRSSTVAGNEEPQEARTKSKRIRARESLAENGIDEEVVPDMTKYYQDQLESYVNADRTMLETSNYFMLKIGVQDLHMVSVLQAHLTEAAISSRNPDHELSAKDKVLCTLLGDLRNCLVVWSDEKNAAIMQGHGVQDFGGDKTGLTLFLQHSKANVHEVEGLNEAQVHSGLPEFIQQVNSGWFTVHHVSLTWLKWLLCSRCESSCPRHSLYMREKWSENMKQTVVQLIICEDAHIYRYLQEKLTFSVTQTPFNETTLHKNDRTKETHNLELIQALFELHLDVYTEITNPSSQVDNVKRIQQRDRLSRWAALTGDFMGNFIASDNASQDQKDLALRFIWAATAYANLAEDVPPDHVMLCLRDLEHLIGNAGDNVIRLPNNAAMPEISVTAVQQEISRLSTLDFFMSVFDSNASNPVAVIERLEPILESTADVQAEATVDTDHIHDESTLLQTQKLVAFLESGDASLKLYLWRRLRDAYQLISYIPKAISCNLRAIEAIMNEIKSDRHQRMGESQRHISLLKWLRDADDFVAKLLPKIFQEAKPFDCIDQQHLKSSFTAVGEFCTLLLSFAIFEDSLRIGQVAPPPMRNAASVKSFDKSKDRFREMLVRAWTLLYTLSREVTVQQRALFEHATDDLAKLLHDTHDSVGNRHYCRYSNKVLLKLIKSELLSNEFRGLYNSDIYQALYDLYGVSFMVGVGDKDHGCPIEPLDKQTAAQMVEVVMKQTSRLNIRDLAKTELKNVIEKIQQALGPVKSSPPLAFNKRTITAFLKSPVNPKDLYQCVKGFGELPTKLVSGDSAMIANHGWYSLLGKIALARFKSVKRVNPTPTDDLDFAATFFRQDLEHNIEKWESWYRLAQIYDAKIDDDLLWNVNKVNDHKSELATLQRHAIHAYSMAVATLIRTTDENLEIRQIAVEIFSDFALRLYASSREPLCMQAFQLDNIVRHFSSERDKTMYRALPYRPMSLYAVWSFAAYLLRQNFSAKPKVWTSCYSLGKCLWKMFCSPENTQMRHPVLSEEVLEAFTEAIETLPARKEKTNEYILEPHFKLVSIVHKMVQRKVLTPTQGVEYLEATPYARKVHLSEDENGPEWEPYILEVLKKLGTADKSNWHHRIIARSAHVLYDESRTLAGALGAKHEFMQQIFTKTMTLQVWKPEYERAGRHYVYTTRYVSFFVTLLNQLNDRSNLDQLLRRVRRKPTEFLNHQQLWEEITTVYARLLRRLGRILEGHEKAIFDNIGHEDFLRRSEMLEKWAHDPDTASLALDLLRDAIELKKLNIGLMKGTMFDDLVADAYAAAYEAFIAQLPPEDQLPSSTAAQEPSVSTPSMSVDVAQQGWDRMRVGNMLASQVDGGADRPALTTQSSSVPIGLGLQGAPIMLPGTPPPQPADASRAPTPVKSGRAKQITKREVIRKAEAAIVKPPPIKTPILSKKPIIEFNTPRSDKIQSLTTNVEQNIDSRVPQRVEEIIKHEGVESTNSSRPGSVHDSADDESELSEIDDQGYEAEKEDQVRKPMFPGLVSTRQEDDQSSTIDGEEKPDDVDVDGEDDFHDAVEGQAEDDPEQSLSL